jgi:hypothetical protein
VSSNPLIEARIRSIQSAAADRAVKRQEAASKFSKREEQRTSVSPNDLLLAERRAEVRAYWDGVNAAKEERDRQERIKEANPKLIKWKEAYMKEPDSKRRVRLVTDFVTLYHKSYGKLVDVAVLAKEWDDERRRTFLARIYGGNDGTGKV